MLERCDLSLLNNNRCLYFMSESNQVKQRPGRKQIFAQPKTNPQVYVDVTSLPKLNLPV